jgi:DNA mismatch endonuclease (patch repair protein)
MDKINSARRSANMRAIASKNTSPELAVRALLRKAGFVGYRLHWKDLPGRPDIAFVGRQKAIFVHGCFWHGHECREGVRRPRSRTDYWLPKIAGNKSRDANHEASLVSEGWDVLTLWECEITRGDLMERLIKFLSPCA